MNWKAGIPKDPWHLVKSKMLSVTVHAVPCKHGLGQLHMPGLARITKRMPTGARQAP